MIFFKCVIYCTCYNMTGVTDNRRLENEVVYYLAAGKYYHFAFFVEIYTTRTHLTVQCT